MLECSLAFPIMSCDPLQNTLYCNVQPCIFSLHFSGQTARCDCNLMWEWQQQEPLRVSSQLGKGTAVMKAPSEDAEQPQSWQRTTVSMHE